MTQITENKHLEDDDSESDAWSWHKKVHSHKVHFLSGHEACNRGKIEFVLHILIFLPQS